ncbi:uncharacterized protein C8Q71DRAFT_248574 [Rhodofomes roseus]|uniref:F-box domain-containing protein n=1 Tax=Rhodofomes roseus TaxID=34475 RepID=A0ABQ8K712_9APHY|nr:uncharacterized protein C8Q71DRAFT_248574 [Rhodofomes roseus]KAH9833023.1 hypothetical protein C8Q71DRAFT_248574 [Rhodofomes roseus]
MRRFPKSGRHSCARRAVTQLAVELDPDCCSCRTFATIETTLDTVLTRSTDNMSLGGLDADVCHHILRELSEKDLWSILHTCRWLREACMPLLFRTVSHTIRGPWAFTMHERFLVASCKPYVQTLILHDKCPDQRTEEEMTHPYGMPLYYTKDRTVCGAWPGGPVAERLRELPALRSLTI